MNVKTTLFLLVMVVGVAAYVFFFELDNETTYEREEREADVVQLEGDALIQTEDRPEVSTIERLEVEHDGKLAVIERNATGWSQTNPVTFPMQGQAIERVCRELLEMRVFETFEAGADNRPTLGVARLAEPRAVIRLKAGDKTITASLGRRLPGNRAYLQLDDDTHVMVVDDDLHLAVLDEGVNNWRATTLTAPTLAETSWLVLEPHDAASITLHNLNDRWSLDEAGIERADQEAVRDVVSTLARLRIDEFRADQPDDLALYGLDRPNLMVTSVPATDDAQTDPTPPLRLIVGGPADMETTERFATVVRGDQDIDVVFTVRETDLKGLRVGIDKLRDKRVLAVEAADLQSVRVRTTSGPFGLLRGGDGVFRFGAPDPGYGVDRPVARQEMASLAGLQALGFADTSQAAQELGSLEVTITGEPQPVRIRVFEPAATDDQDAEPRLLLIRDQEPFGYLVNPDHVTAWLQGPLAFKDRNILALRREQITQVAFRYPDRELIDLVLDRNSDTWKVNEAPISADHVDSLLELLSGLRADHWLKPEEQPTAKYDAELSQITVWAGDEEKPSCQLKIDTTTKAGFVVDDGAWFALDDATLKTLLGEIRPTSLIMVSPSDVQQVSISLNDQQHILERNPQGVITVNGEQPQDIQSAVRLVDLITRLEAKRLLTDNRKPANDSGITLELTLADGTTTAIQLTDQPPSANYLLPVEENWFLAVVDGQTVLLDRELFDTASSVMQNL